MLTLHAGELQINVEERPDVLLLFWSGKSVDRNPGRLLEPFFADALTKAVAKGIRIEMRFDRLDHFNSSTISCLIQMIEDTRAKRTRLTLTYDSNRAWQRVSFDALRVFQNTNALFELRKLGDHEQAAV